MSYSAAAHRIDPLVRQTPDGLKPALQESGASITVGALPKVLGDGERMFRVFQNLVSNSLKYRNSHPPRIDISATKEGSEWVVAVKDNGIGFEQQYADDVFGLFKRLH